MMILLAFMIAVVAVSLMMTVLVASTRPLRAHDDPIFITRNDAGIATRNGGRSWTDGRKAEAWVSAPTAYPDPGPGIDAASARPRLPASASTPSDAQRINPNTWGLVRAEARALRTARNHIRA